MCRLSVNINKLATIRNARGGNNPDLVQWAKNIQSYGAHGITIHPRPDERHVRRADVYALKEVVHTEFNIEGYPSDDFMNMVIEVKPDQVTLVPDPPEVLTSNAGWDAKKKSELLKDKINRLRDAGIRSSIFMETDLRQIEALEAILPDRIELYTESYAKTQSINGRGNVSEFAKAASMARDMGMGINAGHDLDLHNLQVLVKHIPFLNEVSIGHALICDALVYGMENTVQMYLNKLR